MRHLIAIAVFFALCGGSSAAPWESQRIMFKSSATPISLLNTERPTTLGWNDDPVRSVMEDRDGKLRLGVDNAGVKEGWIAKSDAVLLEDAPDYFTGQIAAKPTAWAFGMRGLARYLDNDYAPAARDFTEAIRLDPSREVLFLYRGNARERRDDLDGAITDYSEAIKLAPKNFWGHYNRAFTRHKKKEFDKALADFESAIRLDRKNWCAYFYRGQTWKAKKEYTKALADFREACRLDPEAGMSWDAQAWLLATCPDERVRDGKLAVAAAKKALALDPVYDQDSRATLAAAHAETGDFEEAVRQQKEALADPQYAKAAGAEGQRRLKLYEAKRPYREE